MTDKPLTTRAQKKREQIRVAAQRLFLHHGFTNTSMDAITAEAGVSKQTLYSYYTRKEDLFADVLRQLTLEHPARHWLAEAVPPFKDTHELRILLISLAHEILQRMLQPEYQALLRIIIAETTRFPHLGPLFKASVPERVMVFLTAILKQAQEQKLAREKLDYEAIARLFIGSLLTYSILDGLFHSEGTPQIPPPERVSAIVDTLMQAITP